MKKEKRSMPIPLRPIDPPEVPVRARRRVLLGEPRARRESPARAWVMAPFRVIRREPELAVVAAPRQSDNDGWPCQPYGER